MLSAISVESIDSEYGRPTYLSKHILRGCMAVMLDNPDSYRLTNSNNFSRGDFALHSHSISKHSQRIQDFPDEDVRETKKGMLFRLASSDFKYGMHKKLELRRKCLGVFVGVSTGKGFDLYEHLRRVAENVNMSNKPYAPIQYWRIRAL